MSTGAPRDAHDMTKASMEAQHRMRPFPAPRLVRRLDLGVAIIGLSRASLSSISDRSLFLESGMCRLDGASRGAAEIERLGWLIAVN